MTFGHFVLQFEKPGRRNDFDYPQMVKESVTKALADASVQYKDVKQAVVGYVYGESTSGQRALYEVGMTGIPIYNVNSNCSTGANALILGKQLIETGQNDCVLAVGFEKMERGSLGAKVSPVINTIARLRDGKCNFYAFSTPTEPCRWINTLN